MAALTTTVPTSAGVATPGAAVSGSDTISQTQLGQNGCWLEILNAGGSSDSMTISDAGLTPAGHALSPATYSASVANGTNKIFYISPKQVDSNGVVTVTHGFTTSVTYKLYPLG
jgi:hypothetical protein